MSDLVLELFASKTNYIDSLDTINFLAAELGWIKLSPVLQYHFSQIILTTADQE